MDCHQLAPYLCAAGWRSMLSSSQQNLHLLFKNSRKSGLIELKRSSIETRGGRVLSCSSWRTLTLKFLFLTTGEVKTTSLVALVSPDEAKRLALLPSANLARMRWERGYGSFAFGVQWYFDLRVAAKITSTIQYFSSILAAKDFASISKC